MAKSTKVIAALSVVAGLGVVALPMASYAANTTTVEDTFNITVEDVCSFGSGSNGAATTAGKAYTADGINGKEVIFKVGGSTATSNEIAAVCNNENPFTISAEATDLTVGGVAETDAAKKISLVADIAAAKATNAKNGYWAIALTGTDTSDDSALTLTQITSTASTNVYTATRKSVSINAAYSAYIGNETPAETYEGSVTYTIAQ